MEILLYTVTGLKIPSHDSLVPILNLPSADWLIVIYTHDPLDLHSTSKWSIL